MKTKNMLICGVIGTMIGGGAYALDTSEIKAKCEQSDKTVWVEATKVCVPKNPCKNDNYAGYCNKRFADMKFASRDQAEVYAKMYLLYHMDVDGGWMEPLGKPGVLGQDYMAFHQTDGNYTVFEFDSLNASTARWSEDLPQMGYCDERQGWIKFRSDYLPEFCMYNSDGGDIYIPKENIKGNSISDIAYILRDSFPGLRGQYEEGTRDGVAVYYIK